MPSLQPPSLQPPSLQPPPLQPPPEPPRGKGAKPSAAAIVSLSEFEAQVTAMLRANFGGVSEVAAPHPRYSHPAPAPGSAGRSTPYGGAVPCIPPATPIRGVPVPACWSAAGAAGAAALGREYP